MAKINIYVTDELKARMANHELNWSQIASRAIETAINLEETKEVDMQQASIERLRASRESNNEREYAGGVAEGKSWALESAEFDELERVARIADSLNDHSEDIAYDICRAYWDDSNPDRNECDEVLERMFGETNIGDDRARGFVDGAVEVFSEV